MSELIQANGQTAIRKQFLATVSAAALIAYVSATSVASAQDNDRPTVWIELGGQMETLQGITSPNVAPFMFTPADPYPAGTLIDNQRPPHNAFGFEGKVSFLPENSDWVFSAAARYSRGNLNR